MKNKNISPRTASLYRADDIGGQLWFLFLYPTLVKSWEKISFNSRVDEIKKKMRISADVACHMPHAYDMLHVLILHLQFIFNKSLDKFVDRIPIHF